MDLTLTISKTNDCWFDNAIENFYSLLLTFDYNHKLNICLNEFDLKISGNENDFIEILDNLFEHHKNYVCIKKEENGEIKEFLKDFILIQKRRNGLFINLNPILFKNSKEEVPKIVHLLNEKGSKRCVICDNSFKKKYDKLTQAVYPFTTKIKSLNGVRSYKNGMYYSFKDYENNICPLCFLIGILGWVTEKLIYWMDLNRKKGYLFLPKSRNLLELYEFKEDCFNVSLLNNQRLSNINVYLNDENKFTEGKFSTLLCFYSRFILECDYVPNIDWDILEIPLGSIKNVRVFNVDVNYLILNIIKDFIDKNEDVYILFKSILFFNNDRVDWGLTKQIVENLAESFLNNDFRSFSRNFLPKNGSKILFSSKNINFLEYFDLLIYLWRLRPMSIKKEDLKTIKSVANIVAKISVHNSNLFYKLDKIKTIDGFWSCLREISKKLLNPDLDKRKIKESSLSDLIILLKTNEGNWKEIRDLLIIYSAVYFSINSRRELNGD